MDVNFNDAFFDELGRSPGVTASITGIAEQIAATARASAPVDSGEYRNGIVVEVKQQKRSVALVVGTDPKTMLIESKTGNLVRAGRSRRGR